MTILYFRAIAKTENTTSFLVIDNSDLFKPDNTNPKIWIIYKINHYHKFNAV